MAEINIKKEIGKRILEARKAKGLTLKALGELAGDLKQTRLTNWEQGTRTPGPEEIKLLAQALDVSPAFLMCLSDEQQIRKTKSHSHLIPLLDHHQACDAKSYVEAIRDQDSAGDVVFISASTVLLPELSGNAFALKMIDESMMPEIRVNDILVIDLSTSPQPGDFVLVKLADKPETIVCQYKKLSYTSSEFELLTLNDNWPNIKVSNGGEAKIIGVVVQNIRNYHHKTDHNFFMT
ncbi:transcriptional repressor DicA [Legionella pneumophila]|nr:XRE family transcriptional regulator [Legionella pneumophila]CZG39669.1 transcriptional repressor DicA [Legionella pneumophila]CZG47606.1 transcriptional repressor DicA [Legionella pneumophila]CZG49744.1 transcriptional repressor DicA [Legionella pneumophila]CZG53290.1 transcriptional repressor DicA [Legionella pneumophila]CZG54244.1 transcriptional repressor DicA [Legionella pneumophila]